MHQKNKKAPKIIRELFFIRAIACLSVVMIHAISYAYRSYSLNGLQIIYLKNIQMLFMFATPSFILISLIILSHSYKNRKPKHFWRKRWQYLMMPYFCIGFLYVLVFQNESLSFADFLIKLLKIYFLGEWVGYFVIIIVQFYALYFILDKYLQRLRPMPTILLSFILNFLYLYHVNFQLKIPFLKDISFYKYYYLFFFSWIFYFVVGYYIGRHLDRFTELIKRYYPLILIGILLNYLLIIYLTNEKILTSISSKRVDILLYTCLVLFGLYYIGSKIKKIPTFLLWISQSSYGIYLLHDIILKHVGNKLFTLISIPFPVYILLQFLMGVLLPMGIVYIFNQWKKGPLLVGKINLQKIQPNKKSITWDGSAEMTKHR